VGSDSLLQVVHLVFVVLLLPVGWGVDGCVGQMRVRGTVKGLSETKAAEECRTRSA
jgi:hypothetical protein